MCVWAIVPIYIYIYIYIYNNRSRIKVNPFKYKCDTRDQLRRKEQPIRLAFVILYLFTFTLAPYAPRYSHNRYKEDITESLYFVRTYRYAYILFHFPFARIATMLARCDNVIIIIMITFFFKVFVAFSVFQGALPLLLFL